MIMRLLSNSMPWLLAVLIGLAVFAGMYAKQMAAERDAAVERTERAEQRADVLSSALAWQRRQNEIVNDALTERDEQLEQIASDVRARRDALDTLEADDADMRDWSAEPVPDAARDWVRDLPASSGNNRSVADDT